MKQNMSLIASIAIFILATTFVLFVLNSPGLSLPWNNSVTYTLFLIYIVIMVSYLTIVASRRNKSKKRKKK